MIDSIADFLIALLIDFKGLGPVGQVTGIGGLFAMVVFFWRLFFAQVRKKQVRNSRKIHDLQQERDILDAAVKQQQQEIAELKEFTPAEVIGRIGQEKKDNNYDLGLGIANGYLRHHSVCLNSAYCMVIEDQLSRVEEGLEALLGARRAAWGALAASPDDSQLEATLAEIEAYIRVENSAPEDKDEMRAQEEMARLKRALEENAHDPQALFVFGRHLHERGRYRFAEQVYRRAERVLRASYEHGIDSSFHLSIRHEMASAIGGQGRYAEHEAILRELLPIREKVLGKEHPNVLTTQNNLGNL